MSASRQIEWTIESFLAWEEQQELRYEFDGFQPIAMTGGTFEHDAVQVALVRALGNRLEGKPCRVHGNSLKIRVMGSIRYPDAFVSCTPVSRGAMVLTEPVVIFEIMSKSTARIDRTRKNREYAGTGSVLRYVMLEQTAIDGMMFVRAADGQDWVGHVLQPGGIIQMPEIGIELPLDELYRGLDLSDPDPAEII